MIKKVNGTHRWMLTARDRRIVTALLAARQAAFVEVANEDEDGPWGGRMSKY